MPLTYFATTRAHIRVYMCMFISIIYMCVAVYACSPAVVQEGKRRTATARNKINVCAGAAQWQR